MSEEKKEKPSFKIIDRRHSASDSSSHDKTTTQQTHTSTPPHNNTTSSSHSQTKPNFTMKDAPPPPPVDFPTFILSLATTAMVHMGLSPNPQTQKIEKNLELAKYNIEIIAMLEEKTKGNLSLEEQQFIQNILTELRLRFVQASS